jgi:HD-GYP domain-containing protein (c-di-GMP phosphodiesterase class II)
MDKSGSLLIDVNALRVGLFVELDLGWMAHPFSSGSFKITHQKQIDTIAGLGLKQVRYDPDKSDPEQAPLASSPALSAANIDAAQAARAQQEQTKHQLRADAWGAQQRSLLACDRRFADTLRQYRQTAEQAQSQPELAAKGVQTVVTAFVGDLLGQGETTIRLLSDAGTDKAAMHATNVTILSLLLGRAMGLPESDMLDLGMAAFVHDMGKVSLPERVRWVEENFTSTEIKMHQEHVASSVALGRSMKLTSGVLLTVAQHHEWVDGSGFPQRLTGEKLGVAAKVLALVNRFDNLCNPLRVNAALTPHEALSEMFTRHKAKFDPAVLGAFIRMMGVYPVGSVVQLLDERYASVVSNNSSRPLKPSVIVFEAGVPKSEALVVDLEKTPGSGIRKSLKPKDLPPRAHDYLAPRQRVNYFYEKTPEDEASSGAE